MTVIGLTGPTGSGKTTALRVLETMGFRVIDCDAAYYELLKTDEVLRQQLTDTFGNVFLPDGQLDRRTLGTIVFGDREQMAKLNAIVYPAMDRAVAKEIAAVKGRGAVIDAINLIESGLGRRCDLTVAITAPQEVRLRRIMARDSIDEAYARQRIEAQKKDAYYKKHCHFLLENRARSQKEFEALIREFFEDILLDTEE